MPFMGRSDKFAVDTRQRTLRIIAICLFAILGLRLFHLQVVRRQYFRRMAVSNRIQRERVIAPRGLIRSRKGTKLVVNVPVYQINILPERVRSEAREVSLACRWLGIDRDELMDNLRQWKEKYPDGREMPVIKAADKSQISVLKENSTIFPFFRLVMKHRRQYPQGDMAAHLLGYVGEVTDLEIEKSNELKAGDITGRTGVEYSYDHYLTGEAGVRVVEINAEGFEVSEIEGGATGGGELPGFSGSKPPVSGKDVHLTLDVSIQRMAEDAFQWDMGSVIVMDPHNGEVLAAVSRPGYDPNMFLDGISRDEWMELNQDHSKPLFNRLVQATYPPGSIFKLVTAYYALEEGLIGTDSYLKPCRGGYQFGRRFFRCWKEEGHGSLSLYGAIVQSCDTYFYQIGEMMTTDQFYHAGRLFGLGKKTGIDLPGEARGVIPSKSYLDRKFGSGKWTRGLLLNYSIGQGEILVTPVQMCQLGCIVANGGKMIHPHVVKKVVDNRGNVIYRGRDEGGGGKDFDQDIIDFLGRSMVGVVSEEKGTGRIVSIPGVEIAGKTGTAQNPHGEDHAIFVAFAPAGRPEIVLAIVMENAGHGSVMAGPVAREIFYSYFNRNQEVAGGSS